MQGCKEVQKSLLAQCTRSGNPDGFLTWYTGNVPNLLLWRFGLCFYDHPGHVLRERVQYETEGLYAFFHQLHTLPSTKQACCSLQKETVKCTPNTSSQYNMCCPAGFFLLCPTPQPMELCAATHCLAFCPNFVKCLNNKKGLFRNSFKWP